MNHVSKLLVPARVKDACEDSGLTPEGLAQVLGVDDVAFAQALLDGSIGWNAQHILTLCEFLNAEVDDFISSRWGHPGLHHAVAVGAHLQRPVPPELKALFSECIASRQLSLLRASRLLRMTPSELAALLDD